MIYLQRFLVWLAHKSGAKLVVRPDESFITAATEFVTHVDGSQEPWEWKQRQCIRALMNRFPNARIRDLNFAIEITVQACSADR